MMLRALWIWQRWIAAAEPKVRRIAFDNAFAVDDEAAVNLRS
jgi:hypothetical protein